MRDDRNPPVHPDPNRPQLGARPFAGGRPPGAHPGPVPPSGSPRAPRPFAPRPAQQAVEPQAKPIEAPRAPEPSPVAAASPRRTPRMLAALVQEERVAIWPVHGTLEQPALPSEPDDAPPPLTERAPPAVPSPESRAEVPEAPGTVPEAWGATAAQTPADPADAPVGPPDAVAATALSPAPPNAPEPPAAPPVEYFLADPPAAPPPELAFLPPTLAAPRRVDTAGNDPAADAARTLEAIAQRIRCGEIVVARGPSTAGKGGDAAVLAAVLASLLGGYNG